MSRAYLDLCRDLVSELGVAGGSGPAAVKNQSGELANMVRWVAESDIYVQNLWSDWSFLWTKAIGSQVDTGTSTITSITNLGTEVEDGLILHANHAASAYRPKWLRWPEFRREYGTRAKTAVSSPAAWTVRPDGVIELSHNTTAATPWSLEYYKQPVRLVENGDLSLIPNRFERIIVARAAIMYGVREDAPEIVSGFTAEYADTLDKMESFLLPGQRSHRRSQQNEGLPQPDFLGR